MLKIHGRIKNSATSYNLNKLTRYDREEPSHCTQKVLLIAAFKNLRLLQKILKQCSYIWVFTRLLKKSSKAATRPIL